MKTLTILCCAAWLVVTPAAAGIFCENDNGAANGVWQTAVSWDGTTRLTCNGAVRPVYYRIVVDAAWDAQGAYPDVRRARRDTVQAVFDDAWRGDTIRFTAGQVFRFGHPDYSIQVNDRPGTGYLTVTTTEESKLPPSGTRITPAYKPVMATVEAAYKAAIFGLNGNGPSPATHVIFRGLYLQPTTEEASYQYKPQDDEDNSYPLIRIGGGAGFTGYNVTTGMVRGEGDARNMTVKAPTQGGNVAGQTKIETARAAWLTSGTKVYPSSRLGGTWYEVDEVFGSYVTIKRNVGSADANGLTANINTNATLYVPVERAEYQPDQIIVQHCVFVNPKLRIEQGRLLLVNSRHTIVRDSFFSGPFSAGQKNGLTIRDTQAIAGVESPGPHYIENNYIDGGSENLMYGGNQFSGIGSDPNNPSGMISSDIKYNWFGHIPERDYLGTWLLTQDTGVPNATRTYSGVSVPGLIPNSPRLVFPGRIVFRATNPATGLPWTNHLPGAFLGHKALNLGVVGTTEPAWDTTLGGETYDYDPVRAGNGQTWCNGRWNAGDGVCWKTLAQNSRVYIKNNLELKHGKNVTIQHNVFDWFGSMKPYNVNQYMMINIKSEGGNSGANCLAGMPFPYCWRGETKGIHFLNNVLRGHSGGIGLYGNTTAVGPAPDGTTGNGDYTVKGNLFVQTERPWHEQWVLYKSILIGRNSSDAGIRTTPPNILIENNTFYTPFILPKAPFANYVMNPSYAQGTRRIDGNIWNRSSTGSMSYGAGDASDTTLDGGILITDFWPRTIANGGGGEWGKNIILGAAAAGFPENTVWTGCPSTAACITSTAGTPDWSRVFVNPDAGDFRLLDEHWGKRAMPDGSDVGANPDEVPQIMNLTVSPTDRMVHLSWHVTPVISHIPCVVEVHSAPDFESTTWQGKPAGYAGELSDMAAYHGADSDMAFWNVRSPTERTLTIGRAVPLTPGSTYYYRLHCGGDVRRGSFTTLDQVDGVEERLISRVIEDERTRSMQVEYGSSYSRDSNTIENSAVAISQCSAGEVCSVTLHISRGGVVYYRWREHDEEGAVIRSSEISNLIAQ